MNGIKLKVKQRGQNKKRAHALKAVVCVLLSNGLLFFLLTGGGEESKKTDDAASKLQTHEGLEKLLLPVDVFVPLSPGKREYPVGLYDERHQLVVPLAYLHPDFKGPSPSSMLVEVPPSAMNALLEHGPHRRLSAFPHQKGLKVQKKAKRKRKRRKSPYEITF